MKPLTIDELKALSVGDWVWVVDKDTDERFYACKDQSCIIQIQEEKPDDEFAYTTADAFGAFYYYDYGTGWLAYKNKEFAESKGEWVELPCLRQLIIQYNGITTYPLELVYVGEYGQIQTEQFSEYDKSEAERRLAELRGEQ